MLTHEPIRIDSVEPQEGEEGTIITLEGEGFGRHPRSNCIVIGGMGACARVLEGGTDTEVRARIDPVARVSEGNVLAWPGVGSEFFSDPLNVKDTRFDFVEVAIFQNSADQAEAPGSFKLTEASSDTYGGQQIKDAKHIPELRGAEKGSVTKASFQKGFFREELKSVDVCLVLKEPTTTLDFTASIDGRHASEKDVLDTVATAIVTNFRHIGVNVSACVVENEETGGYDLLVTKPYMERSMFTVHFSEQEAKSSAK